MLTAAIDASALYSALIRDALMWLAVGQIFQPKWSDRIHEEWMRAVGRNRPDLTEAQLERTRGLMNLNGGACMVTNYESLIETVTLPDPDDRHVLAAAIHGNASIIVTHNLRHFPNEILRNYNILAQHPDDFFVSLLFEQTIETLKCFAKQRIVLNNPPCSVDRYIEGFVIAKLPKTANLLRQYDDKL